MTRALICDLSSVIMNHATPGNFPCGSAAAKKRIRLAFRNSKDARTTITKFQEANSLHSMLARALAPAQGSTAVTTAAEEPLDPSPVLDFLTHLGVSRHEVHARVASAMRSAIEEEIQRIPIAAEGAGAVGHRALLSLLQSVWQFRDVPDLRPVLVCGLKRLGDRTPVLMLRRLGTRRPDGTGLKNAELVATLGPHLQRLVWEADWDAAVEADARDEGGRGAGGEGLTLAGSTILADLLRAAVASYVTDAELVRAAELSFVGTASERRFATKSRRTDSKDSEAKGGAGEARSTLASIGIAKVAGAAQKKAEAAHPSSSAVAVGTIEEGEIKRACCSLLEMVHICWLRLVQYLV